MNYSDALSFIMAGACAVQVGTATFIDPYAIPKIIEGLKKYLSSCRCLRIGDLQGVTHGSEKTAH
jgi:dihydroorotate dehydrogenase (NAD+) catalytic subunit